MQAPAEVPLFKGASPLASGSLSLGPPLVALGSQPCAHTGPHSSSCGAEVIYRAVQAGHGQGRTLASFTGRPRPWAHSFPKPAAWTWEPLHCRGDQGISLEMGYLRAPVDSGCYQQFAPST